MKMSWYTFWNYYTILQPLKNVSDFLVNNILKKV